MAEAGKAAPLAEKTDEEKEQESVNMQGDMKTFRAKHYFRLVVATAGFVVTAWLLGRLGCGLFWMVPFLVFIFSWWNRTSSEILETTVRLAEMESHRMKAFKNAETAEWLNFIVNRWYVFNPFKMLFLMEKCIVVDVVVGGCAGGDGDGVGSGDDGRDGDDNGNGNNDGGDDDGDDNGDDDDGDDGVW